MKRHAALAAAVALAALVQVTVQASLLARGVDYVSTMIFFDDVFYYLNIAWNYRQLGLFTFDGLHATNGVQFLWFVATLALAAAAPTKDALALWTFAAVVALNAACYYPVWRIGRALGSPGLAAALAAALLYLHLGGTTYAMGMENSLHLLVLLLLASVLVDVLRRAERRAVTGRDLVVVSLMLGLAVWTRIDSALIAVPLYGWALWLCARRGAWGWRPAVASAALAGTMAAVMLAAFDAMGGTALPVSGLVKQAAFYEGFAANAPEVLARVLKAANPILNEAAEVARALQKGQPVDGAGAAVAASALAALALCWAALELRGRGGAAAGWARAVAPLPRVCLALAAVALPHFLYVSSFPAYLVWYTSPEVVPVILGTGLLLHRIAWLARPLASAAGPAAGGRAALAGGAAAALLAAASWTLSRENLATADTNPDTRWVVALQSERLEIARRIRSDLPPDVVLAAWNAGLLGYYAERRLINLDGLVNDLDYYREVLPRQNEALPGYLAENGVAMVIDRAGYDYAALDNYVRVPLPERFTRIVAVRSRDFPLEGTTFAAPGAAEPGRGRRDSEVSAMPPPPVGTEGRARGRAPDREGTGPAP
jgi:hypothetical protein